MPSFAPLNTHFLSLLDELIDRHGLRDPFLDVGCGTGYPAAHLARRGWVGVAVDDSAVARAAATRTLAGVTAVEIRDHMPAPAADVRFNLALLLDVLEHVEDDTALLTELARRQPPGGALVLTVPTNAREWRWDDEFYGHLRRYDPSALDPLLRRGGYQLVVAWDVSFPVFWLLRRIATKFWRPPTAEGTPAERTATHSNVESAFSAADSSSWLLRLVPWRLAFAVQRPFRDRPRWGNEMMVLARRLAHR